MCAGISSAIEDPRSVFAPCQAPTNFGREYRAALNGKIEPRETEQPRCTPAKNGSLRWLIEQYYASAEFKGLDTSTKSARRGILDNLCNEPVSDDNSNLIGSLPYASMPTSKVRALRDRKAELPEAANGRIKALRQVFKYAIAAEHPGAERNPARDVPPYMKTGSQGFHTWTIAEVLQYAKKHPIGTKAYLALALLLFTGQRRSDVVQFGRQHIKSGWLTFTQVKNRKTKPVTLSIPIMPWLQSAIDASPCGDLTFLVTEFGRPFTANGFGNKFRDWCDRAGLGQCSAHGLRKAGACIAAENGATEKQLMAIFGWQTMKEAAKVSHQRADSYVPARTPNARATECSEHRPRRNRASCHRFPPGDGGLRLPHDNAGSASSATT